MYAYNAGGEGAVGAVFLARLIPAASFHPSQACSAIATRASASLLATNFTRAVLVTAAALAVFAGADPCIVYGLAIAATIAKTPFRSAHAALTPGLARTPTS